MWTTANLSSCLRLQSGIWLCHDVRLVWQNLICEMSTKFPAIFLLQQSTGPRQHALNHRRQPPYQPGLFRPKPDGRSTSTKIRCSPALSNSHKRCSTLHAAPWPSLCFTQLCSEELIWHKRRRKDCRSCRHPRVLGSVAVLWRGLWIGSCAVLLGHQWTPERPPDAEPFAHHWIS